MIKSFIVASLIYISFSLSFASYGNEVSHNGAPHRTQIIESKTAHQFKPLHIDITGPFVTETDEQNPFLTYVQWTKITHENGQEWLIRGYFAADGNAHISSASQGNLWRSKFTPPLTGKYEAQTQLFKGEKAGLKTYIQSSQDLISINQAEYTLDVGKAPSDASGFDKTGFLKVKNGYFFFPHTQEYWLKGGSNSPENLLAYWEIDGTYRESAQSRKGESASGTHLHKFAPHIRDYESGDPLWGDSQNKGKGLIGAINYLSSRGLNAQYFLTMNISGDGRDVWPFIDHKTFDRFDVSKLAQWDLIFEHMQNKGIMLHIVTQETENETLFDEGNTGDTRKLYYAELIARFAHHKALVWNMGEENGPESWTPIAQSDQQRIAMAKYFEENDAYEHPVLIHSHSNVHSKKTLFPPLYSSDYDGISFQVDQRQRVFDEIDYWRTKSAKERTGEPWLITMDEIGKWYTGARVDEVDTWHDSLRQHVLWPTFLAGGSGVEWYSGAKQAHNDLSTEDFRARENLWKITTIAREFIQNNVPIWSLKPNTPVYDMTIQIEGFGDEPTVILPAASTYSASNQDYYLAYSIAGQTLSIDMPAGRFNQTWLDPISGQRVDKGNIEFSGTPYVLEFPEAQGKRDWVVLLQRH